MALQELGSDVASQFMYDVATMTQGMTELAPLTPLITALGAVMSASLPFADSFGHLTDSGWTAEGWVTVSILFKL